MKVALAAARILLVDLPQLMSDLIADALADDPTARIVGILHDVGDLSGAIGRSGANCVIMGSQSAGVPRALAELTIAKMPPDAAVVPVAGGDVYLYVLRPQTVPLGDVSGPELVEALQRSIEGRVAG